MKKSNLEIPMRRETVFGKNGGYSFVVEKNILLHHEAMRVGLRIMAQWMKKKKITRPIRVLDLACGGAPVIPNAIMKALSPARFEYRGIDINADQVAAARDFAFAGNVKVEILEGDAWALEEFSPRQRFDWIFVGLNTHHAIPEELDYLARKVRSLLAPGGLYMNHDKFRPAKYKYLPRPEFLPDQKETMRLIPLEKLKKAGIHRDAHASFYSGNARNWREVLFKKFEKILQKTGCDQRALELALYHVRERDYPVSVPEMRRIFSRVGFKTKVYGYGATSHPLKKYFHVVLAQN